MAIYFSTTEITNIDNLVPQSGLDITDMWFGSTNVYTIWGTYEGTPPATFNANGDDMRQYQIYGSTGGVGDITENKYDKSTVENFTGTSIANANRWSLSSSGRVLRIPLEPSKTYTLKVFLAASITLTIFRVSITDSDSNPITEQEAVPATDIIKQSSKPEFVTFQTGVNTKYMLLQVSPSVAPVINGMVIVEGTTPPETYVPFGYEVDMGVKSGNIFDKSSAVVYNAYISTEDIWATSNSAKSIKIGVKPSTTYTISTFKTLSIFRVGESSDENITPSSTSNVANVIRRTNTASSTFTTSADAKVIIFQGDNNDYQDWVNNLVAQEGDTFPAHYQPYYNTVTPIYIGSDPLEKVGNYADYVDYQAQKVVKEIKKYVLDGSEDWQLQSGSGGDDAKAYFRLFIEPLNYLNGSSNANSCSHFDRVNMTSSSTSVGYALYNSPTAKSDTLNIRPENITTTTLSDFKTWLAEQYAANTPVTVWCTLTTAEETDPPVPLPALPTCDGATVVDYAGSGTSPEKVMFKYRKEGF